MLRKVFFTRSRLPQRNTTSRATFVQAQFVFLVWEPVLRLYVLCNTTMYSALLL